MRVLVAAVSGLLLSSLAFAQHAPLINTGPQMRAPSNAYRYGNILFPGGIQAPRLHPGRLGGSISGSVPYTGVPPGHRSRGQRTVVVPFGYPVAYPDYGYQQQPNVTVMVPSQPTQSVVINQYPSESQSGLREHSSSDSSAPSTSGLRVYETPQPADSTTPETPRQTAVSTPAAATPVDDRPTIYLIALNDSTIRQAIGYWVENSTLHYVTPQGTINRVTLDMVDRDASERFNSERQLEFNLQPRVRASGN